MILKRLVPEETKRVLGKLVRRNGRLMLDVPGEITAEAIAKAVRKERESRHEKILNGQFSDDQRRRFGRSGGRLDSDLTSPHPDLSEFFAIMTGRGVEVKDLVRGLFVPEGRQKMAA